MADSALLLFRDTKMGSNLKAFMYIQYECNEVSSLETQNYILDTIQDFLIA